MAVKKSQNTKRPVETDDKKEIIALQEELDKVKANLARRIRFIEQLLATLPNLAYIYDLHEKRIIFANEVSIPLLGYPTDAILSMDSATLKELVHPEDIEHVQAHYAAYSQAASDGMFELEFRIKHSYGDWHWISVRETPYEHDPEGTVTRVLGTAEDATERRLAQEKIWYASTHDSLTGLYNLSYYEEEISRLERGRRYPVTAITADVDGIKEVNDKYGYAAGDLLICGAAEIIKDCFRGEDVVARIGGDEFGILLPETGMTSVNKIQALMDSRIGAYNSAHPKNPVSFTMGFATANSREALRDAVREANRNMIENKRKRQGKSKKSKSKQQENHP